MKPHLILIILLIMASLSTVSCRQENTCEDDKTDEKWQEIVDNDSCTKEQKGEAYLALGGFDSFDLLKNPDNVDFVEILGLTKENWSTKYNYFHKAVRAVIPVTESTDSDFRKSVYFFGSFLRLYTYVLGTLEGSTIDGNIESSEIEAFTGVGVVSAGNDGTVIDASSDYQIKANGNYYIIDQGPPVTYYTDKNADGSRQGEEKVLATDPAYATVVLTDNWTMVNQVMHMTSLSNPLQSIGNTGDITTFSTNLLNYMDDIDKSLDAIGIDATHDARRAIDDFRGKLDNGTENCVFLDKNPALRVIEMIVSNSQKTVLDNDNYENVNLFSVSQLQELGETNALPTGSFLGSSLVPGIKMLFKATSGHVPYWDGASQAVKNPMQSLDDFNPTEVQKNDGKIAFSEIICLSETMNQ